jgi:hypothetical protein
VKTAAKESGAVTFRIARGGLAGYNRSAATNVYFAYPGSKYQVEVFDPNPARAGSSSARARSGRSPDAPRGPGYSCRS